MNSSFCLKQKDSNQNLGTGKITATIRYPVVGSVIEETARISLPKKRPRKSGASQTNHSI